MDYRSIQVTRSLLAFSWIYHGVFPKLITVAPSVRESIDRNNRLVGISLILANKNGWCARSTIWIVDIFLLSK